MQISHSVPVPSTDSHCKILLVSSSMNSTWLFFLLLFFSSFSLLFSVHLLCAFHTFMLSSLLLYDISSFYWNIKKLTSLYNSVLFFLLHTADFLFHFRKSWQFHLGIAYLLIYCLLFIDLFSDREGESWEYQTIILIVINYLLQISLKSEIKIVLHVFFGRFHAECSGVTPWQSGQPANGCTPTNPVTLKGKQWVETMDGWMYLIQIL